MRILRKGAGVVETVGADSIVELPQPQDAIYWGARMKLVPLPRLEVGDAVEVETYMKGFLIAYLDDLRGAGAGRGLEGSGPGRRRGREVHPADARATSTTSSPSRIRCRSSSATTGSRPRATSRSSSRPTAARSGATSSFDAERLSYSFWKEDLPAWEAEPRAVSSSDIQPKVVLATVPSWEDKSRWFAQVNEPQFEATPAIRAKVAELTAGLTSDEDRIAAIVHWAADNIRYSGITMGKGEGYTLHPGSMIFEDRSGVCKDKAGMAITMLRAAGFTVYPAMTMAGARVERIPADQFNHCVTALRKPDGSVPAPRPDLGGPVARALVLGRGGAGFPHRHARGAPAGADAGLRPGSQQGPDRGSGAARRRWEPLRHARRDRCGGGRAAAPARDGHGERRAQPAELVRAARRGHRARRRARSGQDRHRRALEDPAKPVRFEVRYRIPGYALRGERTLAFAPPGARHPLRIPSLAPYFEAADLDERKQAVQLSAPRMMEFVETIQLPGGLAGRPAAGAARHGREGCRARRQAATVRDGALAYDYRLTVKRRIVPVEEYTNFRDVIREAKGLAEDQVILVKEAK